MGNQSGLVSPVFLLHNTLHSKSHGICRWSLGSWVMDIVVVMLKADLLMVPGRHWGTWRSGRVEILENTLTNSNIVYRIHSPWRWRYFATWLYVDTWWYFDFPWRWRYFDTWRYFDCWFHGICRWLWKAAVPWATPQLCQLLLNGRKNRGGEQVYTSFFQLSYFPPHFVAARTF